MSEKKSLKDVELYAWMGEDEHGSGEIGIKQGLVPAGLIPLVSIDAQKISRDYIINNLQRQADMYGKTIRLCKYVMTEEVITLRPG